jgi:hypothetical protein
MSTEKRMVAAVLVIMLLLLLVMLAKATLNLWLDVQELRRDEPGECVGVVLS